MAALSWARRAFSVFLNQETSHFPHWQVRDGEGLANSQPERSTGDSLLSTPSIPFALTISFVFASLFHPNHRIAHNQSSTLSVYSSLSIKTRKVCLYEPECYNPSNPPHPLLLSSLFRQFRCNTICATYFEQAKLGVKRTEVT